jgi:hypothetical protein
MIVCLVVPGLAFSCLIAGCGTSDGGTPGKSLKMINNTSVTVTCGPVLATRHKHNSALPP